MQKLDAQQAKRLFFMMDIIRFKDYINFMEEFLETEKNNQEENLKKIHTMTDRDDLIVLDRRVWYAQTDEFAGILRRSFFISIFSFFENRLINEYRVIRSGEIDKRGELQNAINYFAKDESVAFPSGVTEAVQNYRIVRNCIVHAQGTPKEMKSEKEQKTLESFLKKNENIFLSKEGICLKMGFCEEAIQNIEVFLRLVLFPDKTKR